MELKNIYPFVKGKLEICKKNKNCIFLPYSEKDGYSYEPWLNIFGRP